MMSRAYQEYKQQTSPQSYKLKEKFLFSSDPGALLLCLAKSMSLRL